MILYVTRWTDRQAPKTYKTLLSKRLEFESNGIELKVIHHGENLLDEHTQYFKQDGGEVIDANQVGAGYYTTRLISKALQAGVKSNHDIVGVIDDDALIGDPYDFTQGLTLAYNEGAVCFGPVVPFMYWQRYESKHKTLHDGNIVLMGKELLCTPGCQLYRRTFLEENKELWLPQMQSGYFIADIQFGFLAHIQLKSRIGFKCKSFRHAGSGGAGSKLDYAWAQKKAKGILKDTTSIEAMLDLAGDDGYCLKLLHKDMLKHVGYLANCMAGFASPDVVNTVRQLKLEDIADYFDL